MIRAMAQVTIYQEPNALEVARYIKPQLPANNHMKMFQDIAVKDEHTIFIYGNYEDFWLLESIIKNVRNRKGVIFAMMI